ncbi:hypothetical protein C4K20_1004 [Pseudomonas chlororaphis subsp. aurantiaca]|jgi:hypothetical protein|nr:hypothetical protein C4K20_1004 [Pseudomonas chlororaphis subsp. aurantiaca]AZD64909.1 hypothetical protein C4K17_1004 [Pseudomonas chlororaphis subsp. aurantiaca]AZD77590.1 hypothetical protein C4K15_1004 [Pseudomonas chlororaphis subsp. aurantiaca]
MQNDFTSPTSAVFSNRGTDIEFKPRKKNILMRIISKTSICSQSLAAGGCEGWKW